MGATVTVVSSSTALVSGGNLYISSGTVYMNRGHAGKIFVSGGVLIIDALYYTFAEIEVSGTGSVTVLNSGTITTVRAISGTFDVGKPQRPITVTNLHHCAACNITLSPIITTTNKYRKGRGADGL
jgi:hypothetical protein